MLSFNAIHRQVTLKEITMGTCIESKIGFKMDQNGIQKHKKMTFYYKLFFFCDCGATKFTLMINLKKWQTTELSSFLHKQHHNLLPFIPFMKSVCQSNHVE